MIQAEGVESLSERELVMACRDRGLLRPQSVEELREEVGKHCSLIEFVIYIVFLIFYYYYYFIYF